MSGSPVVQAIVRYIAQEGFKPGDKLPTEFELMAMLNVSRPVLREAMSALEAVGVLAARKGSGRVVMPFNFSSALETLTSYVTPKGRWLLDLLSVRQVLETNLISVAAPLISVTNRERLELVVSAMEEKAHRGEYFGHEDREFHLLLYAALKNEVLEALLNLFWTVYDQIDINDLSHSQRLDETAAHHRRILEAIKAGDVRRATHYLNAHFYDTGFALSRHADPEAGVAP